MESQKSRLVDLSFQPQGEIFTESVFGSKKKGSLRPLAVRDDMEAYFDRVKDIQDDYANFNSSRGCD